MKKKVILSIAVVLLVVMVAMMATACSTTPDKIEEAFEKKDCVVEKPSLDELGPIVDNLDDAFFNHVLFNYEEKEDQFVICNSDNLDQVFVVYKKDDSTKPIIFVFWYKDKDSAKKAQSQANTNLSDNIISGDAFTSGEIASGATEPFRNKGIVRKGNALIIGDQAIIKSL